MATVSLAAAAAAGPAVDATELTATGWLALGVFLLAEPAPVAAIAVV